MNYLMTTPCNACPFTMEEWQFDDEQLEDHSSGEFACHKTCDIDDEGVFEPRESSSHCAGALIYLEKRNRSHQMMRIAERINMYDRSRLDMDAKVR